MTNMTQEFISSILNQVILIYNLKISFKKIYIKVRFSLRRFFHEALREKN